MSNVDRQDLDRAGQALGRCWMKLATSTDDRRDRVRLRHHDQRQQQRGGVEDAVRQRHVAADEDRSRSCGAAASRPAGTPSRRRRGSSSAHGAAVRQRMAAAHDQAGLLDADDPALEQPRIEVVGDAGDDEIVARGEQFARQHVAGLDLHADLDAAGSCSRMRGSPAPPARSPARSPRRETPSRPCRLLRSEISRSTSRISSSIVRARRASAWPYGVSAMPRGSRSHSSTPRMASISAIMRDAAGCEMLRTCAAALTWPCSSSATIMRMWRELQAAAQQARRCRSLGSIWRSIRIHAYPHGSSRLPRRCIAALLYQYRHTNHQKIAFDSYINSHQTSRMSRALTDARAKPCRSKCRYGRRIGRIPQIQADCRIRDRRHVRGERVQAGRGFHQQGRDYRENHQDTGRRAWRLASLP